MASQHGIIHRIFTGLWTLVDQARRSIINVLFILLIYFVIKSLYFTEQETVKVGSALVISPFGYIVDELDYVDPVDEMFEEISDRDNQPPQILLKDILMAIDNATDDAAIEALILKPGVLYGAAPSKLHEINDAIKVFKKSGKKVYSFAQFYNQKQYLFAAQADEIIMDPLGSVYLEGYSRYNTYFKEALDKLGIVFHVFKVGTFKSAVEPYIRNNMSDPTKLANLNYLGDLWDEYQNVITEARHLDNQQLKFYTDHYLENMAAKDLKTSKFALDSSLVDSLLTREEFQTYLIEQLGATSDGKDYRHISLNHYLELIKPIAESDTSSDKVAVIVAKGVIYNGKKKAGSIGGQSTAKLLRRARKDSSVKAVVLRVDSPGGSAYASEIIRREVVALKESGKPIVISMGSYAASGGYWISASADEIWANSTTITGSIGIFGLIPTFEKPLKNMGIHRDGVGTTSLSGMFDATKPLREDVATAIQGTIEKGYDEFISIVAEGRGLSKEQVNSIGQGRVWSGKAAKELGLVDYIGDLDDAIGAAAKRADLSYYEVKHIEQKLTSGEQLINDWFKTSIVNTISEQMRTEQKPMVAFLSPTALLLNQIKNAYKMLTQLDDPQNMYAHCLCTVSE